MLYPEPKGSEFTEPSIYQRLNALGSYLAFYLDHFLAEKRRLVDTDETFHSDTKSLRNIILEIAGLAPRLPKAREFLSKGDNDMFWLSTIFAEEDRTVINPLRPDFEDKQAAILFGFAQLIDSILVTSSIYGDASPSVPSAMFLCRLCAGVARSELGSMLPSGLSLTRSLFWAGLILTRTRHPAGNAVDSIS
jgi:hypothetical protein